MKTKSKRVLSGVLASLLMLTLVCSLAMPALAVDTQDTAQKVEAQPDAPSAAGPIAPVDESAVQPYEEEEPSSNEEATPGGQDEAGDISAPDKPATDGETAPEPDGQQAQPEQPVKEPALPAEQPADSAEVPEGTPAAEDALPEEIANNVDGGADTALGGANASASPVTGLLQTFTVVFMLTEDVQYSSVPVWENTAVPEPAAPSELPAGMNSFTGWTLADGTPYDFSAPVTGDLVLYAAYSSQYLVQYKVDGLVVEAFLVAPGGRVPEIAYEPVAPQGTSFIHWYVEGGDPEAYYDFSATVSRNLVLVPFFANAYLVNFVTNGTSVEPQLVYGGSTVQMPEAPVRQGYTFLHWSTEADGPEYNFAAPVAGAVTLYAVWQAEMVDYTVVFYLEKENLPLDFDKDDIANYTPVYTYIDTALAGSRVGWNMAGYAATMEELAIKATTPALKYSTHDASAEVTVQGNGSSKVNVYFTRNVYTMVFNLASEEAVTLASLSVAGDTYTIQDTPYTLQVKLGTRVEDVWPTRVAVEDGSGYGFVGWKSAIELNEKTSGDNWSVWSSGRAAVESDMLPKDPTIAEYRIDAIYSATPAERYPHYYMEVLNDDVDYYQYEEEVIRFGSNGSDGTLSVFGPYGIMGGILFEIDETLSSMLVTDGLVRFGAKSIEGFASYVVFDEYRTEPYLFYRRVRSSLTFDTQGGDEYDRYTYTDMIYGQPLDELAQGDPYREGYTFRGWYTDAQGLSEEEVDFTSITMPAHDLTLFARWEPTEIYASFYDGVGGSFVAEQGLEKGGHAKDPEAYTVGQAYPGKGVFLGWYWYVRGSLTAFSFETPLNTDTNLYAMWQTDGFTITYDTAGGTGAAPEDNTTYELDVMALVLDGAHLTKDGQVFIGWQVDGNGSTYYAGNFIEMYGPVTLVARYTQPGAEYVWVTYHANDGSGATLTFPVEKGERLTVAQYHLFTREKHTLTGWNTQANGAGINHAADETIVIQSDTALYAVWRQDTATLTYHANYGTGETVVDGEYAIGDVVTLRGEDVFQRSGYRFLGWGNNPGTEAVTNDPGTRFEITGDMTLYAVWEKEYHATYNANGGEGTVVDPQGYVKGDTATVKSNTDESNGGTGIYRDGYSFVVWNTRADGQGDSYVPGGSLTVPDQDLELYAIWQPNPHTITYYSNDGAGASLVDGTEYDAVETLRDANNSFTRTGYELVGWATAADDTYFTYSLGQQDVHITGDLNLYAVWGQIPSFRLTYDANNGTGETKGQPFYSGDSVTLLGADTFVYAGHTLLGWATTKDGPVVHNFGANETFTGDTTLYAVWEIHTFTVEFKAGAYGSLTGADVYTNIEYNTRWNDSWAPGVDANSGYYFTGWDIDFPAAVTENLVFVAQYQAQTSLTLTANDHSKIYDGTALAAAGYTHNGALKSGDVAYAAVSGSQTNVGRGSSTITSYRVLRGTRDVTVEYDITTVDGTLEVTPAPLAILVHSASKTVGEADPAFTGTVTGLVSPDDGSAIGVSYRRADGDEAKQAVGDTIVLTADYDTTGTNYEVVNLDEGELVILPIVGELAVYADPVVQVYDGEYHGLEAVSNITGATIRYLDEATGEYTLTGSPVYKNTGTYPVYFQATHPSHAPVTGEGSITILPRPVTITVDNASKYYGEADPAPFTGTVTGVVDGEDLSVAYRRREAHTGREAVGDYIEITATYTDQENNYDVSVQPGILEILAYPVTVRFAPGEGGALNGPAEQSLLYGDTFDGVAVPTPVPDASHVFTGWSPALPDAEFILTEDLVFTATWALKNEAYTVEHYLQQPDGSYRLEETEAFAADYGTLVEAVPRSYEHHSVNTVKSTLRATMGENVVLSVYYDLEAVSVRFVAGENGSLDGQDTYSLLYGSTFTDVTVPTPVPAKGYTFDGWSPALFEENAVLTGTHIFTASFRALEEETTTTTSDEGVPSSSSSSSAVSSSSSSTVPSSSSSAVSSSSSSTAPSSSSSAVSSSSSSTAPSSSSSAVSSSSSSTSQSSSSSSASESSSEPYVEPPTSVPSSSSAVVRTSSSSSAVSSSSSSSSSSVSSSTSASSSQAGSSSSSALAVAPGTEEPDGPGEGGGTPGGSTTSRIVVNEDGGYGEPGEPEYIEPNGTTRIFNQEIPTGGLSSIGGWSLFNLMLSLLTLFSGLVMAIRAMLLHRKEQQAEEAWQAGDEDEEQAVRKHTTLRRLLAAVAGTLPILVFMIVENITSIPILFSKWTPLVVALCLVHVAAALLAMVLRRREDTQAETAEEEAL